jgi:RNA polymerase sigma factor (sigma-70 family)
MTAVDSLKAAIERLAGSPKDEDAWRFLYREMRPFVLAVVYRRLKNRAAAEDAAQEVFFRVLRARPFEKIREEGAFRGYVWRIALNVANTHLRKAALKDRGEHHLFEWGTAQETALTEQLSQEHDLFLMEEALQLVMDDLEPNDRKFLEMLMNGSTLSQAATALDISYSSAGVRFHRLKKKLRNILK